MRSYGRVYAAQISNHRRFHVAECRTEQDQPGNYSPPLPGPSRRFARTANGVQTYASRDFMFSF